LKEWQNAEKSYLTSAFGKTTGLNPGDKGRYRTEFLSKNPAPQKPLSPIVPVKKQQPPSTSPPRSLDLPEGMEISEKGRSRAPTQPVPVDPQDVAKGIQSTAYNAFPDGVRSALWLITEGHQPIGNRPPFNNLGTPLPGNPTGYYKEVDTVVPNAPGQRQTQSGGTTRSSLRFVIGRGGEVYYSSDHYASFTRVANVHWTNGAPGVW
jgi:guanyl-specific ribonuclease Sa